MQLGGERREIFHRPQFRIQTGMIDDIIPMPAAGLGRGQRRNIEVGNTQLMQIRDNGECVAQGEIAMELQAISRAGNSRSCTQCLVHLIRQSSDCICHVHA